MRFFERALLLAAVVCLAPQAIQAQVKTPTDRLLAARALYYTPTTAGLKSFHCDLVTDWKGILSRSSGKDIPDDNPFLKYLQSAHVFVTDDLNGAGTLEWSNTAVPAEGLADPASKMRDGVTQMISGFFTSWNGYMNGSMVPAPAPTDVVSATTDGIHVHGSSDTMTVDEDFDKNMLLTQAHVVTPDLDAIAYPTFDDTTDGRIVSSFRTDLKQPVTAPIVQLNIAVIYQTVSSFRIPASLHYDLKNVGQFDFTLSGCSVVSDAKPTTK